MAKKDILYCAKYPFTRESKEYVKGLSLTLSEILAHPVYGACLGAGKTRFLDGLRGTIHPELGDSVSQELTVLSYPIARLIAALVGGASRRKYALSEASAAYEFFKQDARDYERLAAELGLVFEDGKLPIAEFLRLTERLARADARFRLVNRKVRSGFVEVLDSERKDILREKIGIRVAEAVDVKSAPAEIVAEARRIEVTLSAASKKAFEENIRGAANPPCITEMIALMSAGQATHNIMFILGTYLFGRGYQEDRVVEVFSQSPSFDESKTRYQLRFLSGQRGATKYSCPTCAKIKSYGLCKWECPVKHPLQYKG
ncbi:MAG: hypothetical protein ABH834_05050 [Candidatus Altiarchaeota archaeon]